jgi:hypothetical protein
MFPVTGEREQSRDPLSSSAPEHASDRVPGRVGRLDAGEGTRASRRCAGEATRRAIATESCSARVRNASTTSPSRSSTKPRAASRRRRRLKPAPIRPPVQSLAPQRPTGGALAVALQAYNNGTYLLGSGATIPQAVAAFLYSAQSSLAAWTAIGKPGSIGAIVAQIQQLPVPCRAWYSQRGSPGAAVSLGRPWDTSRGPDQPVRWLIRPSATSASCAA